MVDTSATRVATVLIQADCRGKIQVIFYVLRVFAGSEQKNDVIKCEKTAIVHELNVCVFFDIWLQTHR